MGSIHEAVLIDTGRSLLGVLNKMGSIPWMIWNGDYWRLLGVLNKMGSILETSDPDGLTSLLGVLNKMRPIRVVFVLAILSFAKCVKMSNP